MAKVETSSGGFKGLALLERAALMVSMASLALLGLLVLFSIVARTLLRMPIPDDVLLAELLIVPIVALPLAYAQRKDEHIAITLFTNALPAKGILALRALGNAVGLALFLLMTRAVGEVLVSDFLGGHYHSGLLDVPVWPIKGIFFLALATLSLRLLSDLMVNLLKLFSTSPHS